MLDRWIMSALGTAASSHHRPASISHAGNYRRRSAKSRGLATTLAISWAIEGESLAPGAVWRVLVVLPSLWPPRGGQSAACGSCADSQG